MEPSRLSLSASPSEHPAGHKVNNESGHCPKRPYVDNKAKVKVRERDRKKIGNRHRPHCGAAVGKKIHLSVKRGAGKQDGSEMKRTTGARVAGSRHGLRVSLSLSLILSSLAACSSPSYPVPGFQHLKIFFTN